MLSITISDAIHPAKPHCNMIPILWDLIETHIKGKRQLLLSWRNKFLLLLFLLEELKLCAKLKIKCVINIR